MGEVLTQIGAQLIKASTQLHWFDGWNTLLNTLVAQLFPNYPWRRIRPFAIDLQYTRQLSIEIAKLDLTDMDRNDLLHHQKEQLNNFLINIEQEKRQKQREINEQQPVPDFLRNSYIELYVSNKNITTKENNLTNSSLPNSTHLNSPRP